MKVKASALALFVIASLGGCTHREAKTTTAVSTPNILATQRANDTQQRELANGLYEMVISPSGDALYVASAEGFKDVQGGAIYKLNPKTLQTLGITHTDLKNFGMAMAPQGKTIYITNSLDGGVSALNTADGKITDRLLFKERNDKGFPYGARQILWHNGLLYIGGVADPGVIWVVDAKTMRLKTTIRNAGKWVTGLFWSQQTGRLYAANGGGEILVINPHTNRIEKRWKPLGSKAALLLNLAGDSATGRLFVTDNSKAKTTLILDINSGKLLKQLDTGDALAVKFNAPRNEIYISQRDSAKVLCLDATSYVVKKSWNLPPHPNSLALSADGQVLYVTVKQSFNKDRPKNAADRIVRIALNQ